MSGKTNIALALLLIAVSTFAYMYEFKGKAKRAQVDESSTILIAIERDAEVESVKLVVQGKGTDIEMRCTENCKLSDPQAKWELVSPIQFKADEANIGTFITTTMSLSVLETLPIEGDNEQFLARFGLGKDKRDARKTSIKLKKDASPYVIYLGESAAVGDNLYVYVQGPNVKSDVVRIVPGHVRTSIERKLSHWRSKKLFRFAPHEVEKFKLTNPSGTVELTKDGANWYLAGKQLADNEAVDTFLTGLAFMNVQDYVSDAKTKDRAKLGLSAQAKYAVNVKAGKEEVRLEIYDSLNKEKQSKAYAMLADKNFIAELDRVGLEKFGKKSEAFRFRNLITAAEKQEVESFDVQFADKSKFSFARDAGQWKSTSGPIDGLDLTMVDQALTKIGAARIAEFNKGIPAAASTLSTWTLKKKDGQVLRVLTVSASKDKATYYVRLQNNELAVLERGSGSTIPSSVADFKAPKPTAVPAAIAVPKPGHDDGHQH